MTHLTNTKTNLISEVGKNEIESVFSSTPPWTFTSDVKEKQAFK